MLALALIVGVATFYSTRTPPAPPADKPLPKEPTQILAAARDLPTGTILHEGDVKWVVWADLTDNGKFYVKGKADQNAVVGAVLRESVRTDEPLFSSRVAQPHEQGFLAAVLTPGMRALSVSLTPSSGVAGFIFPGDHVDVILTHSFPAKSDRNDGIMSDRRVSETIVRDTRVLALDQKTDNQSTDPKVAQLATLEVTPKQAEKIVLAEDMASQNSGMHAALSLALRALAVNTATTASDDNERPTMDSDISPVYARLLPTDKVEVMRGKDTSETVFQKVR